MVMWVKPVLSGWDKARTLISKFEEKSWDIDIEKITVSHCHHIACISSRYQLSPDRPSHLDILVLISKVFSDELHSLSRPKSFGRQERIRNIIC